MSDARRIDYAGKPPVVPRSEKRSSKSSYGEPSRPNSVRNHGPINSPSRHHEDRSKAQRTAGSAASGSKSNRSTPRSVVLGSVTLSRDLSDLSGSYYHGTHVPSAGQKTVPRHIYRDDGSTISSLQKSWMQAYVISTPSPDTILNDLMDANDITKPCIFLEVNNSIELVRRGTHKAPLYAINASPRIPIFVLLMDTNKRTYEILRIFIDTETDNVRDVLNSIRKNLPDYWKQDYDGLLQVRSEAPSQLIHCLSVQHYDVNPYELWIAKPWSMSAKIAGHCGDGLIDHLKHVGVLVDTKESADTIIKLSEAAAARIYEPDGILDHYHAQQYLSFSPPFEKLVEARFVAADNRSISHGSAQSVSTPRSASLSEKLQALREEDDENTFSEESHEVQTVSSYSYLSSIDPFPSIFEDTPSIFEEAKVPVLPYHLKQYHAAREEPYVDDFEKQSPKLKGFVGKLLGRGGSNTSSGRDSSSSSSSTKFDKVLRGGQQAATWDLTPMNSASSIASGTGTDEKSQSSSQPLLQPCGPNAAADKMFLFRRMAL
jgi:hypothetical protein